MEYIFAGSFQMGSKMNTGDMDEWPIHNVELNDFYIDKYEVTKEEFEKVMGHNPSGFKGCNTCPVDNVTWFEADEYCRKVNKRLPTEAEWEYSCRSGTGTIFHYGNTLSSDKSNFNGSRPYGGAPTGIARNKALPVGSFEPNKWKLYDMHGNVSEWCSDWYGENSYGNSESKNPRGPEEGKFKVVRGGSWRDDANTLRTTNRTSYNPSLRLKSIGFRCAKDIE
jgi:formylglycine-generating enzyme required for sulfatase activity